VLIVGGTDSGRSEVAQAFHASSPLKLGALIRIDCAIDEGTLSEALQHWLTRAGRMDAANPLWPAERGTLYLESVDGLSPGSQQLLLAFVHRCSSLSPGDESGWLGRLAAGCDEDPWDLVAQGRFLAGLADGLDKIRVELNPRRQGGAA
jgi:DNA-binding NtrC family response regulator